MKFSGQVVITFNDIFPSEIPLYVEEYLDGIDKDTLKKFSAFILGFSRNSKFEHPIAFLKMFFSKENADFTKEVFKNLRAFLGQSDLSISGYSFPYMVSSLSFC